MYSTCLFCSARLGTNAVIERFPVGRRLAFDAAKGRLWVVCVACRRWNLTPLEERWEAIEQAEREFRGTRLRISTGEIGLARLREGLELVRVGAPLRPEIAAWRYGEQFGARRRRQLAGAGAIVVGGGVLALGGLYAGAGIIIASRIGLAAARHAEHGFPWAVLARLRARDGRIVSLRRRDLAQSSLHAGRDGGLAFRLVHSHGVSRVEGARALQVARQVFPAINRRGGTPDDVQRAVQRLEHAGDTERFLSRTAARGGRLTPVADDDEEARASSGLLALSTSLGLAMEMALNEDQERRALEGELAELEAAWREAEEVGAIADSLLLPDSVERALAMLKDGAPS